MAAKPAVGPTRAVADHDVDNYPSIASVLRAILKRLEDTTTPVERVEVTALASGEATYRITPARAEEPEGGYFAPDDIT